jgi:hypothetical protein
MSKATDEAVQSVEQLLDALAEARKAIRATEVALRRALKKVEQGSDVATAIATAHPAETRQLVNDTLTAVEQCRHEVRRTVFGAALKEGISIGDLGRSWGFSRQMASRYARESQGQS